MNDYLLIYLEYTRLLKFDDGYNNLILKLNRL